MIGWWERRMNEKKQMKNKTEKDKRYVGKGVGINGVSKACAPKKLLPPALHAIYMSLF